MRLRIKVWAGRARGKGLWSGGGYPDWFVGGVEMVDVRGWGSWVVTRWGG